MAQLCMSSVLGAVVSSFSVVGNVARSLTYISLHDTPTALAYLFGPTTFDNAVQVITAPCKIEKTYLT